MPPNENSIAVSIIIIIIIIIDIFNSLGNFFEVLCDTIDNLQRRVV